MEKTRITVRDVPVELNEKFRKLAAIYVAAGRKETMGSLFRTAIRNYIERPENVKRLET